MSGQAWDRTEEKFWEKHYRFLAITLSSLNTPWGIVPGFHDFESDLGQKAMMDLEMQEKYAVSTPNYYMYYG